MEGDLAAWAARVCVHGFVLPCVYTRGVRLVSLRVAALDIPPFQQTFPCVQKNSDSTK